MIRPAGDEAQFTRTRTILEDKPTGTPSVSARATVAISNHVGTGTGIPDVTVNNVDPSIDSLVIMIDGQEVQRVGEINTINEGQTVTLTGNFTDPGSDPRISRGLPLSRR